MGYTPPYFAESRVEDVRELLEFHIDGIEYLWMDRGRMLNTEKNPGYAHTFTGPPVTPLDCIHYLKSGSPGAEGIIEEWKTPAVQDYVKTVRDPKFVIKCLEFDQKGEVFEHIIGLVSGLYEAELLQKSSRLSDEPYLRHYVEE